MVERAAGLAATTFLSIGSWDHADADKKKVVGDIVDDQIDTVGKAFLGLTLGCARCHDHKFDPISQKDYYSLFAFFQNIDESGQTSYFTAATPVPGDAVYVVSHVDIGGQGTNAPAVLRTLAEASRRVPRCRVGAEAVALHLVGLRGDRQPADAHAARGGRLVAGEDAHRGGLARAVGAEEADNLAARDGEADLVHRGEARVALHEPGDFDGGWWDGHAEGDATFARGFPAHNPQLGVFSSVTSPVTARATQRWAVSRSMRLCGSNQRPWYSSLPRRRPLVRYCSMVSSLWMPVTRRS